MPPACPPSRTSPANAQAAPCRSNRGRSAERSRRKNLSPPQGTVGHFLCRLGQREACRTVRHEAQGFRLRVRARCNEPWRTRGPGWSCPAKRALRMREEPTTVPRRASYTHGASGEATARQRIGGRKAKNPRPRIKGAAPGQRQNGTAPERKRQPEKSRRWGREVRDLTLLHSGRPSRPALPSKTPAGCGAEPIPHARVPPKRKMPGWSLIAGAAFAPPKRQRGRSHARGRRPAEPLALAWDRPRCQGTTRKGLRRSGGPDGW